VSILVALRIDENVTKYKSFVHAIRTTWNAKKISEIKRRLNEIRTELHFRIQMMMKTDQAEMKVNMLQSLDEVSRQVLTAVLQTKSDIVQQQQANDHLAAKRHEEVIDRLENTQNAEFSELDFVNRLEGLLQHEKQNDRFDDIVAAHERTFQWALQEHDSTTQSWPNLYNWLQRESGLYWISGKAGSGKSTLMKYLHKDKLLQASLKEWAGDSQLIVVHFYFWNAGSDLQKSQEGLFRGLLPQVLNQEPSLGPELFQEQFRLGRKWAASPRPLTFHQIRRAFNRLTTRRDSSIKIALLLDGLDEFDASDLTMTELSEMFITITRSLNIKALVLSRPLAPFEYSFAHHPKLRLHDLTYEDIRTYVNDRLATHPRMVRLTQEDDAGTKALISEIVTCASGVFLWVKLVVRSLLEGLQNYDKLRDLQRRLRELPRDLEDLFRHMLRNIPTEYKLDSSRILQMFRSYEGYNDGTLHTVALAFAELDEMQVLAAKIEILTARDIQRYEEEVAGRLRSRCVGLLEVHPRIREPGDPVHPFSVSDATMHVDYLHKSVADFFLQEKTWNEVTLGTCGTDFDPNVALLRSMVMQIKSVVPYPDMNSNTSEFWKLVDKAMHFARLAEVSAKVAHATLLDELDKAMSIHLETARRVGDINDLYANAGGTITTWCDCVYIETQGRDEPWNDDFLAFAIRHGLTLYVQHRLKKSGKKGIQKQGRPLLDLACCIAQKDSQGNACVRADIVASLLQHGADANQVWGKQGTTAWQKALETMPQNNLEWVAMLKHLILHGADLNAWVESKQHNSDGKRWRKSPLRILRTRHALLSQSCPSGEASMGTSQKLLQSDAPMNVSLKDKPLAVELKSVIQLLVDRGAREEEWHEASDGSFKRVYPNQFKKPRFIPPQHYKHVNLKTSRSTRNPFKRMFERLNGPRCEET
jgi:hypothetical protein